MLDARARKLARTRMRPQISWLTIGNVDAQAMNQIAMTVH
jgi:predicted nuclease of predicted toxin-antitoxin system